MASADRTALRSLLQKEARIGANADSALLDDFLYEGVKQLQYDILWLTKQKTYYTREYFSLGTDEGFGITLTADTGTVNAIGVTTAQADKDGTTMAEMLSAELIAVGSCTGSQLTYSTANRKFSIDISSNASTGFLIGPPDYATALLYDASYKLFGLTERTSNDAQTWAANVVPLQYGEYPLPDDFLYVKEIRYDDQTYPLAPEIYKNRNTRSGTPSHYYIYGDKLGLTPYPTTGGKQIRLDYYYLPADFAADATLQPFPEIFDYAIIYYAAMLYKQYQSDMNGVLLFKAKYEEAKVKGIQNKGARRGGAINVFERGKYRNKHDPRRYHFG